MKYLETIALRWLIRRGRLRLSWPVTVARGYTHDTYDDEGSRVR